MALPYTAAALCMRTRVVLAVFLLYLVLTVAMTWPLALAPASLVPADYGDPLLNAWILWWNAQSVPLTAQWWDAPAFHPSHDVLAFSEHLLGLTWLTSPLQWAGADPLAAHNIAFMASWILGGVAAWTLGYVLTGRADAALAGSAVFAFAPYRASQVSHLQVLTAYWMPLALAALHVYAAHRRPSVADRVCRDVAAAGAVERLLPRVLRRARVSCGQPGSPRAPARGRGSAESPRQVRPSGSRHCRCC